MNKQSSSTAKRAAKKSAGSQLLIVLAVSFLTVGVAILMLTATSSATTGETPEFTAPLLTGETVRLSDYRGEVVMLNFCATWCPPCRAEMPAIQQAYQRYHDEGFTVMAINHSEAPAQVGQFINALSLRFPVVLDQQAQLQKAFGISGYPTSIFLDAGGSVYGTHTGMLTEAQLTRYIETGLARGDASASS
ncbi:MAG: TlpA family protein disulfide reductase [Chloroflexi bacterium]|nr:TlpA family protein disulfide reductase [Chloroflexota bacterium]